MIFKEYAKKEFGIRGKIEQKERERRGHEKMKERQGNIRNHMEQVAEEYPIIKDASLVRYKSYLMDQVSKMDGARLLSGRIVDKLNKNPTIGHLAEEDLLNKVYLRDNDIIPVPPTSNEFDKQILFNAMVSFFRYKEFQKSEGCKLSDFFQKILKKKIEIEIEKRNEEFSVKNIKFYTAVGTPLDFNYGVDG
jgi:hypothetical protein